jgi:hypothetical protein
MLEVSVVAGRLKNHLKFIQTEFGNVLAKGEKIDNLSNRFYTSAPRANITLRARFLDENYWNTMRKRVQSWEAGIKDSIIFSKTGGENTAYVFQNSTEQEQLNFLMIILGRAEQTVTELLQFGQTIANHEMPLVLFESPELKTKISDILATSKASTDLETLIKIIQAKELIYIAHETCKLRTCEMSFILFLPIIKRDIFQKSRIDALPYMRQGIFMNSWKQIQLPYKNAVKGIEHVMDYDHFDCFHDVLVPSVHPCELCKRIINAEHDICLETILNKQPLSEECQFDTPEKDEYAIQISNSQYIYTSFEPGKLNEDCNKDGSPETTLNLPFTGVLRLDDNCIQEISHIFQMNEDDDETFVPDDASSMSSASSTTFTTATTGQKQGHRNKNVNSLDQTTTSLVEEHFQEHSVAYLISMFVLLLLSTSSSLIYAWMRKRKHRIITVRNERRLMQAHSEPDIGQALVRFINRETV